MKSLIKLNYDEILKNELANKVRGKKILFLGELELLILVKSYYNLDSPFKNYKISEINQFNSYLNNLNNSDDYIIIIAVENEEILNTVKLNAKESHIECYDLYKENAFLLFKKYHPFSQYSFFAEMDSFFKFFDSFEEFVRNNPYTNHGNKKPFYIIIKSWYDNTVPWYILIIGLLMHRKGHNIEFVFDDICNESDFLIEKGATKIQNIAIKSVLESLNRKYGIAFYCLSEFKKTALTEIEKKELNRCVYYNKVWLSRKILWESEEESYFEKIAIESSKSVCSLKTFLIQKKVTSIFSFTGYHLNWLNYSVLCKALGIKFSTIEYIRSSLAVHRGLTPVINQNAIFETINHNFLTKNRVDKLIEETEKIVHSLLENVELENNPEKEKFVLIPLNIFWDTAAFTFESAFVSFTEWLTETIDFILCNTNANVIIRQHPSEKNYNSGGEIKSFLLDKYKNNERVEIFDTYSNVNTYQLLMDSCLVLPNTSTVGIEASIVGKKVILMNNVYYSNIKNVESYSNKEEYFESIRLFLNHYVDEVEISKCNFHVESMLYYALTYNYFIKCDFGFLFDDTKKWVQKTFKELLEDNSVNNLIEGLIGSKNIFQSKFSEDSNE